MAPAARAPTPGLVPPAALRAAAAALAGAVAAGGAGVWSGSYWVAAAAAAVVAGMAAWRPPVPPGLPEPVLPVPTGEGFLRDSHTGMFHRATFLALAERDWLRAGRYGGSVALLVVEIDHLRQMTERTGPRAADALLAGLGGQVLAALRAADLLARFDDAQLAIFLPQADVPGALDVADRVRGMVENLKLSGLPDGARFSASVGVAVRRPSHQPLSALLALSQQALRQARRSGGNCVRSASADVGAAWAPPQGRPAGDTGRPARRRRED